MTRPWGREFRPLVETIAAVGQTFPPVAVLAIAVPVMGFGQQPAIIALILYGVLPILQATLAGIGSIPESVRSIASGMGMSPGQQLRKVELPLAAPVILAGVRTSVIINIGTANYRVDGRGQHARYTDYHWSERVQYGVCHSGGVAGCAGRRSS